MWLQREETAQSEWRGRRKRLALASVLAMKPEVLVLDEPTAQLDPHGASSLVRLLNKINKEMGITLIFSSHDADIIPLLSDRVYLMSAGKIIFSGTTAEVFAQKDIIRKIGLRLPRVAHLIEILSKQGCLQEEQLPLTIGQARQVLGKSLLYKWPRQGGTPSGHQWVRYFKY